MRRRADSTKLSVCEYLAKFIGYCTLFIGFVLIVLASYLYTLVMGMGHNQSPVALLSLLVTLTLIFGLWIWPSKSLIRGINECKSNKLLPWMTSAGLQTVCLVMATIYMMQFTGLAIFWIILIAAQLLVWVSAFRIFKREKEEMRACDIEALPLQNSMSTSTSNVASILPEVALAPAHEERVSDAPPSYEEAVTDVNKQTKLIASGENDLPPPYSL